MHSQPSNIDDSWFWESEKTQSSTSSKENEAVAVEPVEPAKARSHADVDRVVEKLRRSLEEKDAQLQRLTDENLEMNEKLKRLHLNAVEVEKKIELLDLQHSEEMASLIDIRDDLQKRVDVLSSGERQKSTDAEQRLAKALEENERLAKETEDLKASVKTKGDEVAELNKILEVCTSLEVDEAKRTSPSRDQQELEEIKARLAILNDVKAQYDANVQRVSAVVDEKAQLETTMAELKLENESLLREVRVTREAVEKLEVLQHTLDEINAEKEQNEQAFGTLQEDELMLQREFHQLKADNEKLATELKGKNKSQENQINSLQDKCERLKTQLSSSRADYDEMLTKQLETETALQDLQSTYDSLKTEAADVESRLVEENMLFQKKIIDTQSLLNSKVAAEKSTGETIKVEDLQKMIAESVNYVPEAGGSESPAQFIEAFLQSIKESRQHLVDIEKNRDDLMGQFEAATNEKASLQHECKTLRADLHHYEAEVAELMKNNGILLAELEKVKSGKLETISEQNEDNILRLEKQIEDYSKLNQTLEDEYENMQHRLEEKEEEKYELLEKISQLEEKLDSEQNARKALREQCENADLARTSAQLQLDLLTSDESSTEKTNFEEEIQRLWNQVADLESQLQNTSVDHAELVKKVKSLQDEKTSLLAEIEALRVESNKQKVEAATLKSKNEELESFVKEESSNLVNLCEKVNSLEQENESRQKECDRLTELLESKGREGQLEENEALLDLKQKLSETEAQYLAEVQELKAVADVLNKEKHELVAAVQLKHNENLQYHAKIQELNAALSNVQSALEQSQVNQTCANCDALNGQLSVHKKKIDELNDQIEFLKEKSDIMMKNLLIEQSNQKLAHQERSQLVEEKLQIAKDLERLRQHLIEMEDAHTQEMIEMQKTLEETRSEMTVMQEEARKSSTAYTSAR